MREPGSGQLISDPLISDSELVDLERRVGRALATGDRSALEIRGFGVTSAVLAEPTGDPRVACKRLPPFRDVAAFEHHRDVMLCNIDELRGAGVDVIETDVRLVREGDRTVGYVVQPLLNPNTLGPAVLRSADPGPHPLIDTVVDAVSAATTDRLGLDAQISNWVWADGRARYLDVSTPFLFDDEGELLMDVSVLVDHGPPPLRPIYRREVPKSMSRWTEPRMALLDLVGNLHKEDLDDWIEPVMAAVNRVIDTPVTLAEARRYYGGEVRMWGTVHRLLVVNEWWQRRVRRRVPAMFVPPPDYDARAWRRKKRSW